MDTVEAIRIIALRDVMQGGKDYSLRYLHRWYSKTFSTPICVAQDLDINELLQAFFEEKFEALDEEEREEMRLTLLESEEERQKKQVAADVEAKAEAELIEMSKAQNTTAVPAPDPEGLARLHETPTKLADLGPLPENVKLTFVPDDEFEKLLEGGFANQTKDREPII